MRQGFPRTAAEQALERCGAMQRQGVVPDAITYVALISTRDKGQQTEQALDLCRAVQRQGVAPDAITYDAMISFCNTRAVCQSAPWTSTEQCRDKA